MIQWYALKHPRVWKYYKCDLWRNLFKILQKLLVVCTNSVALVLLQPRLFRRTWKQVTNYNRLNCFGRSKREAPTILNLIEVDIFHFDVVQLNLVKCKNLLKVCGFVKALSFLRIIFFLFLSLWSPSVPLYHCKCSLQHTVALL